MKWVKRLLWSLLILLICLRIALPFIAKRYVNDMLAHMNGQYKGHIGGIHFALWRGYVAVSDIEMWDERRDFYMRMPRFDVDIALGPAVRREFVGKIEIDRPHIDMRTAEKPAKEVKKAKKKTKQKAKEVEAKTGLDLPTLLASVMPFKIERFSIKNGTVYMEQKYGSDPQSHRVSLTEVNVLVENLTNMASKGKDEPLFATGKASAKLMDSGLTELAMKLDPTAKQPRFDLTFQLRKLDLSQLNPLLKWQFGVDIKKGLFELVGEAHAADGAFNGYVKPFIEGLDMGAKGPGPVKAVEKAAVAVVNAVLKNKKTNAVATRVPFSGKFQNPKTNVWEAIVEVLRNAFIKALTPSLKKP